MAAGPHEDADGRVDAVADETPQTYRPLVDGGLVYDDQRGCIHHLNETAALIWESWRAGQSEAGTVRRLCSRYEVDAGTARQEVRRVVNLLAARSGP